MQKFPVPLQGQATLDQLQALKRLNVFSFSTQVFTGYQDWISKTGYAPPYNPQESPKLWADAGAWRYPGRWYVFVGPDQSYEETMHDRVTCGLLSPGAIKFYQTNKEHFPRIPKLLLSWRTNGAQLNIPAYTLGDQYPIGWLEPDPEGPIDFIEGNRIREKYEGPAPDGEKYRVNGLRSDMAIISEYQTPILFFYHEWRP